MNVLIWGAGDGGARALAMREQGVNVLAFIDIDEKKIGSEFFGYPVIAHTDIEKYPFDYIVIANIHGPSVVSVLQNEHAVAKEKIIDLFHQNCFDTRIGTLHAIAQEIHERGISGAAAELGVYQGDFAKYINEFFPKQKLYLFDTFCGFDERDIAIEKQLSQGAHDAKKGEYYNHSIQLIISKMKFPDRCIIKKGYFPQSVEEGFEETFNFVSIDVDLYQPIYEGLNFFYDRLNAGGYIMVHDYNSSRFFGAKKAVRQFATERGVNFTPLMDLCGSVVFSK